MANQGLYLNVLDPSYARYIPVGSDLETYLGERYGDNIDFDVSVCTLQTRRSSFVTNSEQHQNDRWLFRAPEILDRVSAYLEMAPKKPG